jgi:hypothetical protein
VTDTIDPRSITAVERPWLDAVKTLPDLAALRRNVIGAGHPPETASGLVGWLVAKQQGDIDVTSSRTRSKYRRILVELGDPTESPPKTIRRVA